LEPVEAADLRVNPGVSPRAVHLPEERLRAMEEADRPRDTAVAGVADHLLDMAVVRLVAHHRVTVEVARLADHHQVTVEVARLADHHRVTVEGARLVVSEA
jgi:hypothetical protein